MKTAKKIVWGIIALLPILSVLVFAVGNLGNASGAEILPMGYITVTEAAGGGRILSVTPDSLGAYIIQPLFGENAVGGVFGALAGLMQNMADTAGIPLSVPLFGAVLYLLYLAMVELLALFVDMIMFVPRLCQSVLN